MIKLKPPRRPADEAGVPAAEPPYEPEKIERYAALLERWAVAVRRGMTFGGGLLGALFGSVPLTPLAAAWPIPSIFGFATLIGGAAVGALIGYVIGDGRAEMLRLHAQMTLCTLHAQRATIAIWRLLRAREAETASASPMRPAGAVHLSHSPVLAVPPPLRPAPPVEAPPVSA